MSGTRVVNDEIEPKDFTVLQETHHVAFEARPGQIGLTVSTGIKEHRIEMDEWPSPDEKNPVPPTFVDLGEGQSNSVSGSRDQDVSCWFAHAVPLRSQSKNSFRRQIFVI